MYVFDSLCTCTFVFECMWGRGIGGVWPNYTPCNDIGLMMAGLSVFGMIGFLLSVKQWRKEGKAGVFWPETVDHFLAQFARTT